MLVLHPEVLGSITAVLVCLKALLYVLAAVFVVSGFDEFIIDMVSLA